MTLSIEAYDQGVTTDANGDFSFMLEFNADQIVGSVERNNTILGHIKLTNGHNTKAVSGHLYVLQNGSLIDAANTTATVDYIAVLHH